jgi:hypothetical protein
MLETQLNLFPRKGPVSMQLSTNPKYPKRLLPAAALGHQGIELVLEEHHVSAYQ